MEQFDAAMLIAGAAGITGAVIATKLMYADGLREFREANDQYGLDVTYLAIGATFLGLSAPVLIILGGIFAF